MYKKIKTVYYNRDSLNEWVYDDAVRLNHKNKGCENAMISIIETKLYDKKFKNEVGSSLATATSYNSKKKELVTFSEKYYFPEGIIYFDIDLNNQTTDNRVNPGKYLFNILSGTGKYLNLKGYVSFEVFDDKKGTRKVKFYSKC